MDTIREIFDIRYLVSYKLIDYLTVEDIKTFGMVTTGNKDIDRMQAEQWITTMLPISEIAQMYSNGVRLKVVNYDDTKKMYEAITAHISAWKDRIRFMVHDAQAPIEDLAKLDKLAVAVYEHAKYQFTEEIVSNLFVEAMYGKRKSAASKVFDTNKASSAIPELREVVPNTPDYKNSHHQELFKDALQNVRSIIRKN